MDMFSTFNPFVTMLWQALIGNCPFGSDALETCFWQGFAWFS